MGPQMAEEFIEMLIFWVIYSLTDGESPGFTPVRFQQFTQNIQLTAQYARGRSFVAGHNHTVNIFKVRAFAK